MPVAASPATPPTTNGAFTTSGAGFWVIGDDNHLERNNAVHNYIGYLIPGPLQPRQSKTKLSDFTTLGFNWTPPKTARDPFVQDPGTSTSPLGQLRY
jgi:hypothetical protein